MRNRPGGDLLKHVCGPFPISSTPDGRICFLFSNRNDTILDGSSSRWANRDPFHIIVGREMPLLKKGVPSEQDNAGIYFDKSRIILNGMKDTISINRNVIKGYHMRRAQYPQLLHLGNRHFIFYSNTKMDIRVKEIPDGFLKGVGIPFFTR